MRDGNETRCPSSLAQHSFAVGIVHIEHGTVLLGHLGYAIQRGNVAIHGEHAIGYDQ